MNDLINIDLKKLNKDKVTDLIIAEDGSLALEAESELKKILDTQELLNKIVDYVKERLGEEMDKRKLIKVKAGSITISKRSFGSRYAIYEGAEEVFTKKVEYIKPDGDAIDSYVAQKGTLPEGVKLKEREEKVSIYRKEDE